MHQPPSVLPPLLGPYYNFLGTTSDHRWTGSALLFHRGGPTLTLSFGFKVQQDTTILYEDLFGMEGKLKKGSSG